VCCCCQGREWKDRRCLQRGRILFYNAHTPNLNGLIACFNENGGCGEIFHRNDSEIGIYNHPDFGPVLGNGWDYDLAISDDCKENDRSWSMLGTTYGGPDVDQYALFGLEDFRVIDYEVFKIVIE
jgi:hypothetical protein